MTFVWPISKTSPEESGDAKRHGGRNQARKRYQQYCIPARLTLFSVLYVLSLQWSSGYKVVLGCAGATVVWCGLKIAFDPNSAEIWWKREYLLLESLSILIVYSILDRDAATHFCFGLLYFHVLCSIVIAAYWPVVP